MAQTAKFSFIYNENNNKATTFAINMCKYIEGQTKLGGYIPDRDSHPGKDFFDEEYDIYIQQSKCIFVLVSDNFLKDAKAKHATHHSAYEFLDRDNIIPIIFHGVAKNSVPCPLRTRIPMVLESNQWDRVPTRDKEKLVTIVKEFCCKWNFS